MCDPSDMNTDEKIKKCNRKEAEKERQKKLKYAEEQLVQVKPLNKISK